MTSAVGARLAEMRTIMRLTQQEMADRLGVGLRTWQNIERGGNVPSGETLLKIAALGYNPGWILTGQGLMRLEPASEIGVFAADDELVEEDYDAELFGRIVDTIVRVAKEVGASIPPVDLGRRAVEIHRELGAATLDPVERLAMLKLLAVQLKKEMVAPPANPAQPQSQARKGSA